MASIPVKYIVTTKDGLDNIPIVEGQVICLADYNGWFYDMGGVRRETSSDRYIWTDSDTIEIDISPADEGKFEWIAKVKEGSITARELQVDYLSDITKQADRAVRAANDAAASAELAASSAEASAKSAEESGESADESSEFASNANGYANDANGFAQAANNSASTATDQANKATMKATEASGHARDAKASSDDAEDSATESESWAIGGTGTRQGEDTNNAKYYAQLAMEAAQKLSGSLLPKGTILFAQLADIDTPEVGWMYNISDDFITDSRFMVTGQFQSGGTEIYYTDSGKWDCLVGTNVTGVKGSAETKYRSGNVNITKADIGLSKVQNLDPSEVIAKIEVSPINNPGEAVGHIKINENNYTFTSPNEIRYLTSAEYAILSPAEKMKDLLYVITDDTSEYVIDDTIMSKYKTWSSQKIREDILTSAIDDHMVVSSAPTSVGYLIGIPSAPEVSGTKTKGIADPNVYLGTTPGQLCLTRLDATRGITAGGDITATGSIRASAVYSAVWNDFAEWFEKQNENDTFEPGTILSWDETGVIRASEFNKHSVVGVASNSYGYIVGGENLEDMNENFKKFVPVALSGRVNVSVVGTVNRGDFIVPWHNGIGVGVNPNKYTAGTVVGKALTSKHDDEIGTVKILVMLA